MPYKVEIFTATKAGLAAFLLDLKRARIRHQLPFATTVARPNFVKFAKKRGLKKDELGYAAYIEAVIVAWDEQTRVARKIETEKQKQEDVRRFGELGDDLTARHEKRSNDQSERRLHSITDYIGSLNRDVNHNRVEEYKITMWRGDWWFTPDPVVVTDEGYIINGQHRLLAAEEAKIEDGDAAPQFVVVWGVEKRAAILMDEARRSSTDRRDIALRFASAAASREDGEKAGGART